MDAEFAFELQVCQWAEDHWPPGPDGPETGNGEGGESSERSVVVARQLGTERRRWDTVIVECDPAGLAVRAHFGPERLDSDLLHVVRNAPAEWAWYRDALPDPGYPWRYVREAVHRAADRGLVEARTDGRVRLRRIHPYPDWVERIVAVENKPDLDASAARALRSQLEHDVALALADEAWVATAATGGVSPALYESIPVEAGVLSVEPGARGAGAASVAWHPGTLAVGEPGTRILERPDPPAAARFEYADPEWKAEKRLEIAERAYERGWRAYAETMRTDCRHFQLRPDAAAARPYCAAKECNQTSAECAGSCPDFEPEPPAWRRGGWPIEGGPGAGISRLLDDQRQRRR